ncbi:hypothetical protein PHLCEN_2v2132 [Hermanssonia centrifuga]|uniref:Uncharacterized protein n=1 Tax=Hermanssonia centrifuga TaxID=98765 RepID=A0A2R6RPZ4_9APHY|nr:hypothetical protein PHLCEN_2v2132 [Hermanssonia centrifuga]
MFLTFSKYQGQPGDMTSDFRQDDARSTQSLGAERWAIQERFATTTRENGQITTEERV